jgi:hypothetical protein
MIYEWQQIGNDLKDSSLSIAEELLWHLLGDTEENNDNFIGTPPKYNRRPLPQDEPA